MEQSILVEKKEREFDFKLLQANWNVYLNSCGIRTVPKIFHREGLLLLTKCSAQKFDVVKGTPKQLYDSAETQRFISFCEKRNYNYGILSAHYGLVYSKEVVDNYEANVYGSKMSNEKVKELANKINDKLKQKTLLYWAPSPLMSYPYLRILLKLKEINPKIDLEYTTQLGTDEQVTMDRFF